MDFQTIEYAFLGINKQIRCKSKRKEIMKQNRLTERIRLSRCGGRPPKMGLKIFPAIILVLTLLCVPVPFAREASNTDTASEKKAGGVTKASVQGVPGIMREAVTKEPRELKTAIATVKDDDPAEKINTVQLEGTPVLSGSPVRDKGRQIKWQILCTGGNCGAGNVTCLLGASADYYMCGTVGQTSVGPGSSPSYDINSGFWQDFLSGFLRGDANGDGTIGLDDVVYLLNYLYRNGPAPIPFEAGNANCDEGVDLEDVVYLINYVLRGGLPPVC